VLRLIFVSCVAFTVVCTVGHFPELVNLICVDNLDDLVTTFAEDGQDKAVGQYHD
jgi:hypothetical protein